MDGDENAKKDVQPVMNNLRKIADNTDSSIILIHHANKGGGYRGSTAIKASSDLMVQVSSDLDDSVISFKTEKNRDGTFISWSAEASWEDDIFYLLPTSPVHRSSSREEFVINFLKENGESTISEIIKSPVGCTAQGARKAIFSLAKSGDIARSNPEDKTKAAIYKIVEKR